MSGMTRGYCITTHVIPTIAQIQALLPLLLSFLRKLRIHHSADRLMSVGHNAPRLDKDPCFRRDYKCGFWPDKWRTWMAGVVNKTRAYSPVQTMLKRLCGRIGTTDLHFGLRAGVQSADGMVWRITMLYALPWILRSSPGWQVRPSCNCRFKISILSSSVSVLFRFVF